jgi:hypothetical protein
VRCFGLNMIYSYRNFLHKPARKRRMPRLLVGATLAIVFPTSAYPQEIKKREITSDEFTSKRQQTADASGGKPIQKPTGAAPPPPSRSSQRRRYHLASSAAKSRPIPTTTAIEQLGITLWRLRPAKVSDKGQRMVITEGGRTNEWLPERLEVDTPLSRGDRVRLSIESPRAGYLYVVDRDLHADGGMGNAMLIFPTLGMRGGDNQVRAGKLIDIPALEDDPNYFIATPGMSDQIGEVLTIIVTTSPLALPISHQPLAISSSDMAKWERTWSSETEVFEMEGGAGQTWTAEEKEAAAAKSTRQLTRDEPSPQTIFRLSPKSNAAFLVDVRLRYGK